MKVIGLTGGIACGKSSVADAFVKLGINIIDADVIARQLVEPGQPGYAALLKQFGRVVFLPDGTLDRVKFRALIFKDDAMRETVEKMLHPLIKAEMSIQLAQVTSAYCIMAIPLLFEAHCESWVDRILVVDIPPKLQIARVCQRDGITGELAEKMIQAQVSRDYRLQHADDIIDNSGGVTQLLARVQELHQQYLGMNL